MKVGFSIAYFLQKDTIIENISLTTVDDFVK